MILKDRTWKCLSCNEEVDRDINAKNILDLGFHPKNLVHAGIEHNKKIYSPTDSGAESVESLTLVKAMKQKYSKI